MKTLFLFISILVFCSCQNGVEEEPDSQQILKYYGEFEQFDQIKELLLLGETQDSIGMVFSIDSSQANKWVLFVSEVKEGNWEVNSNLVYNYGSIISGEVEPQQNELIEIFDIPLINEINLYGDSIILTCSHPLGASNVYRGAFYSESSRN